MKALWVSLSLSLSGFGGGSAEDKALAYLATEVPRWSLEHRCFSCHNNGDAARALYAAVRSGRTVPVKAMRDTDLWLARPEGWDQNGGDGPFSDKGLARLQFTSALAAAVEAGRVGDRAPLSRAADRLAEDQDADGSWKVADGDQVGSPATYGPHLATWLARETVRIADPIKHRRAIDRADAWLSGRPIDRVMDASTVILAGVYADTKEGQTRIDQALEVLKRGQSAEGGWGPFLLSPTEAFDTALALLALDRHRHRPGVATMIAKGRKYLSDTQHEDGSWTETTRPTGAESYAQRISTSGWATLALITTGKD